MLEIGMLIKTNYSGPYRIKSISRGCGCDRYEREHIHLVCTNPDGTGKFWLNGWDERTLRSLNKTYCGYKEEPDFDTITVLSEDDSFTYQMSFL